MFKLMIGSLIVASLVGCAAAPPKNTSNLCEIFTEKKGCFLLYGNLLLPQKIAILEFRIGETIS